MKGFPACVHVRVCAQGTVDRWQHRPSCRVKKKKRKKCTKTIPLSFLVLLQITTTHHLRPFGRQHTTAIPLFSLATGSVTLPPPFPFPLSSSLRPPTPAATEEGVRAMTVWRNGGMEGWNLQRCGGGGGGEEAGVRGIDPGRGPLFSLVVWIDLIR